ncbi:DHA1 family bicyclomycin/chloramphenicol resistance-like MFS transporter [Hydrogenispora ethanolica]|jgi:DHA1 family bicyclomycin/chloramphenicol resistance-like MFS transporter|uniref:Bcr/CflA family efflux transporter n=1 Tax=Hydrogenispora ethanolica TaxID=1082276 RepID=A0A4R1R875_HYDET|nr:multidrug effflux MFS transporter [Hydrogenispora ethanolica]TCL61855.1 DHA1 family bicyclomycin/chloramphenicol resistance-like MFS transporter [Hydrogenispora ethanolica]
MNRLNPEAAIRSGPAPRPSVLWMALILGALSAFGPLSIDMYLPALPKLAGALKASASQAQLSLTACLLGIALGQIFVGPVSDVRGRRGPLLIGLATYAATALACVFAPNIEIFLPLRFIQGLAGAAGIVIARAAVRDLYDGPELTRFYSLLMLVNGVAPILAPVLGGLILQVSSWRGVFAVLTAVGAAMLLAVLFGLAETLPRARRSSGGVKNTLLTFGRLVRNRSFMGYALSQGFVSAAMFAYIAGSPFVVQEIFGLSPQLFSLIFAINGLGIIVAGQITGRLAGRVTERKLLVAGLTMALAGGLCLLAMIISGGGLLSILVPLFFVVSSVGIVGTSSFSLAMQEQAHAAGSAAALLGLLSFVLGGFMAPLVGIAGSRNALPMGITIAAAEGAAVLSYLCLARETSATGAKLRLKLKRDSRG